MRMGGPLLLDIFREGCQPLSFLNGLAYVASLLV